MTAARVRKRPRRRLPDPVRASPGSVSILERLPRNATRPGVVAIVLALLAMGCLPANSRSAGSASSGSGPLDSVAPASSATLAPRATPPFVRPTPTPAPTFLVYTVKAGDSLNSIAHRFGTTGRSIAYWNGRAYPSLDPESGQYQPGLLKVGWTLQIVPNVTFDEQTLPEPSDLIDDTPSDSADDSSVDASASTAY